MFPVSSEFCSRNILRQRTLLPHHETKWRVPGRLMNTRSVCMHDIWQELVPVITPVIDEHGQHHEARPIKPFNHAV